MSKKTAIILFFLVVLSQQLDLQDTEVLTVARNDASPSFTLAPSKKFALKFSSNPTTGSDWYLQNPEEAKLTGLLTLTNLNENNGGEYIPDQDSHQARRIVGTGGNTYFLLQSNQQQGEVELRFIYKRIWENANVLEKTVVIKVGN